MCVAFYTLTNQIKNHQEMFTVCSETFLSLTSEDFSATIQVITLTLEVHPKHI
jgi:hypothetical protein